jgi:hypothetical protein
MKTEKFDYEKLMKIKDELKEFYPVKEIYFKQGLSQKVKKLEKFVFILHKHKGCGLPKIVRKRDLLFFQRLFLEYETILEKKKAQDFVNHRGNARHFLFEDRVLSRTFDYAIAEGKMAHIGKKDRVLIIGSGPFPESAICYALTFGCKVTCLDKKHEFVAISRRVIKRLKLEQQIVIKCATHDKVDSDEFTKIMVVVLAFPKSDILKKLRPCKSDIILRTSLGSSKLIYASVDERSLKGFKIKNKLIRWGKNFTSSILIRSKNTGT